MTVIADAPHRENILFSTFFYFVIIVLAILLMFLSGFAYSVIEIFRYTRFNPITITRPADVTILPKEIEEILPPLSGSLPAIKFITDPNRASVIAGEMRG